MYDIFFFRLTMRLYQCQILICVTISTYIKYRLEQVTTLQCIYPTGSRWIPDYTKYYLYKCLPIQPNSVKVRFSADNFFVFPSAGFQHT